MPGICGVVDVRGVFDPWNVLQVEERLIAVLEIEITVNLNARILWQLADLATEWTVRETNDATEGLRCWV